MTTVVIHGEGLGKRYHRGALQQSTLFRDHLTRLLKSPLSVFRRPKDETFWALKNVCPGSPRRRSPRPHRPQRFWQDYPSENPFAHYKTDHRVGGDSWTRW